MLISSSIASGEKMKCTAPATSPNARWSCHEGVELRPALLEAGQPKSPDPATLGLKSLGIGAIGFHNLFWELEPLVNFSHNLFSNST